MKFYEFILSLLYSLYFHAKSFVHQLFNNKSLNNKEFKSKTFSDYLKKNEELWSNDKIKHDNGAILVTNFVHQVGYTITECIIAKNIQSFFKLKIVGLIDYGDGTGKKILKSFDINDFIEFQGLSFFLRLFYLAKAFKILKKIKNVDEFINFSIDEISIGRSVYDHILRHTGIGSINYLYYKFYFYLSEALYCNDYSKKLFEKNNFKYMMMAESQFIPSNLIFQNALKFGTKVISRISGPKKIGVRLYSSINEKHIANVRLSNELFDRLFSSNKELYSKKGFISIKDVFDGKADHFDPFSEKSFIRVQNKEESIKKLYELFKWDKSKKICAIFSHNLFDGAYAHPWRIFRDNLVWLRSTLNYIKGLDKNINWIVKEHPSDYGFNKLKTSTYKEFEKIIGERDNIKFFPSDYSPSIIKDLAGCVVTSQGTPGLEYPCFGIPSIVGGDTHYRGFGFTYEPKNMKEYFKFLDNIESIISNGLNKDQVDRARVNYYITFFLTKVEHPLLHKYDHSRELDMNNFFNESIKLLNSYKEKEDIFKQCLRHQLKNNNNHLLTI